MGRDELLPFVAIGVSVGMAGLVLFGLAKTFKWQDRAAGAMCAGFGLAVGAMLWLAWAH